MRTGGIAGGGALELLEVLVAADAGGDDDDGGHAELLGSDQSNEQAHQIDDLRGPNRLKKPATTSSDGDDA